ncbi:AraC family transcriptional regulator [Peribacillus frigoritolerans]|nr:AraC family transcriptional regulator [Peribacillus frigoritolerans]
MEEQLQLILQETTNQLMGSRHACLLTVHQIILDLYRTRINGKQDLSEGNSYSSEWIKDILIYINEHMDEPLTLTILAQKALVSPAHFSRVFKETTGIGLVVYLNTKRIIKAKELLLETNHTPLPILPKCVVLKACRNFIVPLRNTLKRHQLHFEKKIGSARHAYKHEKF